MNHRTMSIAHDLVRAGERGIELSQEAKKYQVSERTIYNDIANINRHLDGHGLSSLRYSAGGHIVAPPNLSAALEKMSTDDFYSYKLSPEERKDVAVVYLVFHEGFTTLVSLAELMSVSRVTVINDLDGIKHDIVAAGLMVESRPHKGLQVTGPERARRILLLNALEADKWSITNLFNRPENAQMHEDSIIAGKILNEQCHAHQWKLTDASFNRLRAYLVIALGRVRQGVKLGPTIPENISSRSFAGDVLHFLSQYCHVDLGREEMALFDELLAASKKTVTRAFRASDVQLWSITRSFIASVSDELEVDLNDDYDLFEFLSKHLESMFALGPTHFPEARELKDLIEENPQVVQAVKSALPITAKDNDRQITEVECTYLVVHVCAALERKKNRESQIHVLVVCGGGVATAQLLLETLRGKFNFDFLAAIPAHEIPYFEYSRIDLIISTVPLGDVEVETVVIPVIPRDEDYRRIQQLADKIRIMHPRSCVDAPSAQSLLESLDPLLQQLPKGCGGVASKIRAEIRRYFQETQHLEREILAPYLHQLLPASHIRLDVVCSDWKEAIAKSAELLLRMDYISRDYIDAMINIVLRNGPYIVLSPGFALAHAAPEQGVHKVGMSLIRLRKPICFGSERFDPVEFVCTLCAVDNSTHLKAFFNLINLMAKDSFKQFLRTAATPEEAAHIIEHEEMRMVC